MPTDKSLPSLQEAGCSADLKYLRPLDTPLHGINLIEASAGTGKTYTIETLFIRLLIERRLLSNKILVVTFTNATTEELRYRIRHRISDTLLAFQKGRVSKVINEDKTLPELLRRYPNHQKVTHILRYALQSFDEAAIFTIHGFCLRMLHDHAFESGLLFDTALINDQRALLQEIVEDFWRQHFYQASPLFINYVLEEKYQHPHRFLPVIAYGRHLNQPFLKRIPACQTLATTVTQEQAFWQAFEQAKILWQRDQAEIEQLLLQNPDLNANKYRKTAIPNWCRNLTNYFNATTPSLAKTTLKEIEKFTCTHLATSVKKGQLPPRHPFFEHCDTLFIRQQALAQQFAEQLLALKLKLFSVATKTLAHLKRQHNFQAFDDLLINLNHALQGEAGQQLALQICQKYPVALIDEFQDTDPIQYQIFQSIYAKAEKPALFFIGDPKQAIYSFRGADIFTYMGARHDAIRQYTLETNWRSDAALVRAINTLFKQVPQPFIFEAIHFQTVYASPEHAQSQLHIADDHHAPLRIWFVSRAQAGCAPTKAITKQWAEPNIALAIGYEIARLLHLAKTGKAVFEKGRPLEAGDIAILVRTNKQAQSMQKTLTQLHIPSVLYSGESLFISHEVMEIERVLRAITYPTEVAWVKAALVTDMLGLSGSTLYQLIEDEQAWQTTLSRFHHYHRLWQQAGFMQMFRTVLVNYAVQPRLLAYPDGERRLTNVLHTAEILQQISTQQNLTMPHICQWLAQQRQSQAEVTEEAQLRLESDEKRVKIVTIHKSKGLEYPIVFCPFVWDGKLRAHKMEQFTFHDPQATLTLDLGSPEQAKHREIAVREEQAENVRLFYVAVTRAKHRCYLVWGGFKDANTSAPARLWYPHLEEIEKTADMVLEQALQPLISASKGTIALAPLPTQETVHQPTKPTAVTLTARAFLGKIDKTWQVTSFTRIAKQSPSLDQPDHDDLVSVATDSALSSPQKAQAILNFPTGSKPGIFFHKLFEQLDFTQLLPDRTLIAKLLQDFGYEADWQATIEHFITQVLTTPLEPQQPDFTLSRISHKRRLNELEFYYPLSQTLATALETEIAIPLSTPTQGLMKGFIDLVFQIDDQFFLVDYKSNFLGQNMQAYHHDQLAQVMVQEGYLLQYHIYTIALHRYLQMRLTDYHYEKHFGGIYYLFLRGMNPHWGAHYGIYRAKPSATFIKAVELDNRN